MNKKNSQSCHCQSGLYYYDCCGPYIEDNKLPDTPTALMRSRYCAYVQKDIDYLLSTWFPTQRPDSSSLIANNTQWIGLKVISEKLLSKSEAEVLFEANYISSNQLCTLIENSLFKLIRGKWLYHSGEGKNKSREIKRGEPCPCGSKKKYKRCCSQ